jgi:hypothetical protein
MKEKLVSDCGERLLWVVCFLFSGPGFRGERHSSLLWDWLVANRILVCSRNADVGGGGGENGASGAGPSEPRILFPFSLFRYTSREVIQRVLSRNHGGTRRELGKVLSSAAIFRRHILIPCALGVILDQFYKSRDQPHCW